MALWFLFYTMVSISQWILIFFHIVFFCSIGTFCSKFFISSGWFLQLKHISLSFVTKISPFGIVWTAFQVFNVLHLNEGTTHENNYWSVVHFMNIETVLKLKRSKLANVYSHIWKYYRSVLYLFWQISRKCLYLK